MKIAVILSGSIREPENSLHSLSLFAGHDVSTFIHTWCNVAAIQTKDSYSRRPNVEPSDELLAKYLNPIYIANDWEIAKVKFSKNLEAWQATAGWGSRPEHETNLGIQGMFYSLECSSQCVMGCINNYDMIVRMRFDCRLIDNLLDVESKPGWNVPLDNDYFGINDQLGWFVPYADDADRSRREASAYLEVYSRMDELIRAGCSYCPESLLKASFEKCEAKASRVKLDYTIRY